MIPIGIAEISRWLSAATPPEVVSQRTRPRQGSQHTPLRPLPGSIPYHLSIRWYRCAQPAANFCDPSRILILLASFFLLQPQLNAQDEAPLINQPAEHFYNAQGSAVKVAWKLNTTSISEGSELTATLIITGATNPQKIVRPDLTKLTEFQSRFVIADNDDPKPDEQAREVLFSYQLRPRNQSVDKVPALEFYFYNPTAPVGKKQFPLAIARAVPITVTEAPRLAPAPIPLREPDYLFAVATGPQLLERQQFFSGFWPWMIVGLAGPFFALGWYLSWQRVYPDTVRRARMHRSRAARRAIDAIHRANRASDPPAVIATAVLAYLRARFPFPPGAVTPGEIAAALNELGVSEPAGSAVAEFFRACDAARFAPPGDNGASLAADAEAVVSRLEAA